MIARIIITLFLGLLSFQLHAQELKVSEKDVEKKARFVFQGDSRQTIINRRSVGIWGVRLGALFDEKKEIGVGLYSSNLFGILGSSLKKDYEDNSVIPSEFFSSEIGFHYLSIYGEYTIIKNKRLIFTANTQVGGGWVDIEFVEPNEDKSDIREGKGIIEHSVKVDVQTLKWLRLSGGIGYRYLIAGEDQIKKAFNAPIYIVGFSIDFKQLFGKKK